MSTGSSQNQTLSFLQRRFREAGIEPKTKHGQNFLIDLNLLRLLVESARLGPTDVVLEVGTGTGSLTALMAKRAAAVVTVEVDPQLFQLASEELWNLPNVVMLRNDVLRNKNSLNERVMDAVAEQLAAAPGRTFKLVSNLPYNIATPLMSNLLSSRSVPRTMTVTIQKELAERIAARPSTKDYSSLSVWIQSQCQVEIVRVMPPTVFWPRPKVHSAILQITVDDELRARIADPESFHAFVRTLFLLRRKLLRNVLISAYKKVLSKEDVDSLLAEQGHTPTSRAEELTVEQILALHGAVERRLALVQARSASE